MGEIHLNNIKLYAYHGCLKEESIIGSDYRVDVVLYTSLEKSCKSDELEDTIDYVDATAIVTKEMAIPSKLLEHVVERIVSKFFNSFPSLLKTSVCVSKINPPIGANVRSVSVKLTRQRDT